MRFSMITKEKILENCLTIGNKFHSITSAGGGESRIRTLPEWFLQLLLSSIVDWYRQHIAWNTESIMEQSIQVIIPSLQWVVWFDNVSGQCSQRWVTNLEKMLCRFEDLERFLKFPDCNAFIFERKLTSWMQLLSHCFSHLFFVHYSGSLVQNKIKHQHKLSPFQFILNHQFPLLP